MVDIHKCVKESEWATVKGDIRLLEREAEEATRQRNILMDKCDDIAEINTSISVISLSLEHMIKYDEKQDVMMAEQHKTLVNINENLNELNQGQRTLNNKVEQLEQRVDESERRSTINIMDIQKAKAIDIMKKYAVPAGVGGTLALLIVEILKIIKG